MELASRSLRAEFMHHLNECLHVVGRDFGEDAVTEIEDVAGSSGSGIEDRFGARSQRRQIGHQ